MELEQLHHYLLLSQIASFFALSSQDRLPRRPQASIAGFQQQKENCISSSCGHSGTNASDVGNKKVMGVEDESYVPVLTGDFKVVADTREDPLPCLMELETEVCLPCLPGIGKQNPSSRQRRNRRMTCQGESAKTGNNHTTSDVDWSAPVTTSRGCVQFALPCGSTETGTDHEGNHTVLDNGVEEIGECSLNHHMMGTSSTRSNVSSLEIQLKGKGVEHSSYTNNQSLQERIQTKLDIFDMKFQKKVQDIAAAQVSSDGHHECWRPINPESREASGQRENRSKLTEKTCVVAGKVTHPHPHQGSGVFSCEKHRPELNEELQAEPFELERRRLQARDEALLIFSLHRDRGHYGPESGSGTSDHQRHWPQGSVRNQEEECATRQPLKGFHSTPAHSIQVIQENCVVKPLEPVFPLEGLRIDFGPLLSNTSMIDVNPVYVSESVDGLQQTQTTLCKQSSIDGLSEQQIRVVLHTPKPQNVDEQRSAATRQSLDWEGPDSVNQTQQALTTPICQPLHAHCDHSGSSSSRQTSASEHSGPHMRTNRFGRAGSEESSNNLTRKVPTLRTAARFYTQTRRKSEVTSCWKDSEQHLDLYKNQEPGVDWAVQSEQDSHSPTGENVGCIEDLAPGDDAACEEDSDAPSVPESDICLSCNRSIES